MNKEEFVTLFKVGEIIDSGGLPHRLNLARLKILSIGDEFVYYRSIKSQTKNHLRYSYLDVVLKGFDKIDPKSIQPSIQKVFLDAGHKKNYSTENYVYGFAKEVRRRRALGTQPFVSSGEVIESTAATKGSGAKDSLFEGAVLRILVDQRERNPWAVQECKELLGVTCICCGFDFESVYGPLGAGFIHVHHLNPLSKSTGTHKVNPAKDLVPICPNCHAMVHRGEELLSISELQDRMAIAKANSE